METYALAAAVGFLMLASWLLGTTIMPAEKEDDYSWNIKFQLLIILIFSAFGVALTAVWMIWDNSN